MNLSRRQKQLYDLLFGRGDVPIDDLYVALAGRDDARTQVERQRWLGPYIARLNRNLDDEGLKVEPGALKGSYRLVAA